MNRVSKQTNATNLKDGGALVNATDEALKRIAMVKTFIRVRDIIKIDSDTPYDGEAWITWEHGQGWVPLREIMLPW
jgi:hypothetical protein